MNEAQRQAYLQVMGIQSYFPRVSLPAAKQSPPYAIEFPVLASSITNSNTENSKQVASASAGVSSQPGKATGRMKVAKVPRRELPVTNASIVELPATSILTATDSVERQDTLQFRLNYYRISGTLAVIDEVPFQQYGQAPDAVQLLLKAILHALDINFESAALQADQFNWPLESGIQVKGDPALAARQALLGYLTMRQQRDGFQQLLVFSSQLSPLLLENREGQVKDIARFDQLAAGGNFYITVTHSLQSLLAHPILKRETWEHLQALRQRRIGLSS